MRPEQLAKATDCAVESILRIMDIYGLEIDESLSYLHILTAAMFRTHDSLTALAAALTPPKENTDGTQNPPSC
jgi:hypothetical protein